ncbi:GH39 family glycosyl hydrolase [Larkinella harenae]
MRSFSKTVLILGLSGLSLSSFGQTMLASQGILTPKDFKEVGQIQPRMTKEIKSSTWSIGGETLDRDYTDYQSYKTYLDALGARRIRLQGGWAKCEKVKGQYDFAWLDAVIPDAYSRGVAPWVELSYGNPIYPGGGEPKLAGRIPTSEEGLAGWDNWVKAMVNRYKNQVTEWEIWNEPDINKQNTGEEVAVFYIRTAKLVKAIQPNARLIALGMAGVPATNFMKPFLEHLKKENALDLIDILTYHGYAPNPDTSYPKIEEMRQMVWSYNPKITFMQGENGAPSTASAVTIGALRQYDWTELSQAKWDLRRMLGDHGRGIATNLFTISDIHYAAGDHMTGVNTKGILKTNADKTIERPKMAYKAAQHVFTTFDDQLELLDKVKPQVDQETVSAFQYRQRKNSGSLVTLWSGEARPAETYDPKPTTVTVEGKFSKPVLVDLISGKVFEIPKSQWKKSGNSHTFTAVPVPDYPVLLADQSVLSLVK